MADLSSWLGKPPATSRIHETTEPLEEAQSDGGSSSEQSAIEEVVITESDHSVTEESVIQLGEKDELASEEDVVPSHGLPSRTRTSFFIDIPEIPNKDDYEHLPGYFTVDRVLAEYPQNKYLVKLGSGEVDLVSVHGRSSATSAPWPSLTSLSSCLRTSNLHQSIS